MNATLIAASLGLALVSLLQHHRRALERHDRIIEAWRLVLLLAGHHRAPPARSVRKKSARPAELPAGRRSKNRARIV